MSLAGLIVTKRWRGRVKAYQCHDDLPTAPQQIVLAGFVCCIFQMCFFKIISSFDLIFFNFNLYNAINEHTQQGLNYS